METRTAPNTAHQEKALSHKQLVAEVSTQTPVAPLCTNPLLSIAAAAYVLGLLYLPRYLLSFLLSPVAVFTLLLLATLLHLGSPNSRPDPQTRPSKSQHHAHGPQEDYQPPPSMEQRQHLRPSPKSVHTWAEHHHSVDFARRGPLEIIYEEYEGEDDDGVGWPLPGRSRRCQGLELLALRLCSSDDESDDGGSLSGCSGVSSPLQWDSPENLCFQWEVEEEGLIEICLEEDSLIEIDLSACR